MTDFLIKCLVSGVAFFVMAYLFVSFADSTFGKALGTSTFLVIFIVLPIIYGIFLGTNAVTALPDSTPVLIGLVFVMPGIAFLVGLLRS